MLGNISQTFIQHFCYVVTLYSGIKVIEMGALIAAPFAARLMAEFGSDVIKIESPQSGDPIRQLAQVVQWHFIVVVRSGA